MTKYLLFSMALGAGLLGAGCKDSNAKTPGGDMTTLGGDAGGGDLSGGGGGDMTLIAGADMTGSSLTWAAYVKGLIDTQTMATSTPDDVASRTFSDDPNATPQSAFGSYFP